MVEIVQEEFPGARVYAGPTTAFTRSTLMNREVDHQVRETFDGPLLSAAPPWRSLASPAETAAEMVEDVRQRDVARLVMQQSEGLMGGVDLARRPSSPSPHRSASEAHGLSAETRDIIGEDGGR